MALIRTLLIIFIVYYVIKLVTRYILPALFYNYMDDKMKEFAHKQQKEKQRQQHYAKKREGEVIVDQTPGPKNKNKSSRGEYVDYVEVKD